MNVKEIKIKADRLKANPRMGKLRYLLAKYTPWKATPFHVKAVLTGADGQIKDTRMVYNAVTTVGRNGIADQLLASPTIGKPTHMAVGEGTGGTTTLNNELDRNALTSKTRSNAIVTMVGTWSAGDGTGALTEAGIFNAASSGDMYTYTTFAVINKAAADGLEIVWTLEIVQYRGYILDIYVIYWLYDQKMFRVWYSF